MSADHEHTNLYDRGWELFRLNRHEDAIKTFSRALQRMPDDAWTLCGLSAVYYAMGDYKTALRFADDAVRSSPDDREGHRRRSLCLLELEQKEEALAAAREAVRLAPENPDCLIPLSMALRALRLLDEAEVAASKLLEVAPERPTAYQELALVYFDQKRFADSVEMNRKGLEIDPEESDLINNLAVAIERLGQNDEALEYYQQALARSPTDKTAYKNLLSQLDKFGYGSVEEYQRSRTNPDLVEKVRKRVALIQEAEALSKSKQHPKALRLLIRALEETPDDVPLYVALSEAYQHSGDLWNALHFATRAVYVDSKDWRGYQWQSWILLTLSNEPLWAGQRDRLRQESLSAAHESVRLSRERFVCLDTLYRIQCAMGQLDEAEQTIQRLVETEPNWSRSYLKMGHVLSQKGQIEEAEAWYRRAVDRKPDSAEAINEVGLALQKQNKISEAREWFLRAVAIEPTNKIYCQNLAKTSPRKKLFGLW